MKRVMKRSLLAAMWTVTAVGLSIGAQAGVIDEAVRRAPVGEQTWSAWGGEAGLRWNRDLLGAYGIAVQAAAGRIERSDWRDHEWFAVRQSDGLQFHVDGGALTAFSGGGVQLRGGYVVTLPDGGSIDLRDMAVRGRKDHPLVLDLVGVDGKAWFYIDRLMFDLIDNGDVLAVKAADVRISPELATRVGHAELSRMAVADLAMNSHVIVRNSGASPKGADLSRVCTPTPWPGVAVPGVPGAVYQADLFMQSFTVQYIRCKLINGASCTGPSGSGGVIFAPSSTLKNNVNDGSLVATIPGDLLGTSAAPYTANISWNEKFTGNVAPYGNDQHPYLIWNLYRVNADGSIEQVARSGVKHAWLTTNGSCLDSCRNSQALGRGCTDTYGTGNNDTTSDLGPRSEILPATGQWGRCGSTWDRNCTGSYSSSGATQFDNRMVVNEQQISPTVNPGANYLFDSWYIARDDINIYNSMGVAQVTPAWNGSTWSLSNLRNYSLGAAIDRWVAPGIAAATANVELAASEGRSKVAVKVSNLGNGNWRYDYAVMNFDFARGVTSGSEPNLRVISNRGFDRFSIPIAPGHTPTGLRFSDGDLDAANDWTATVEDGRVIWTAPAGASLDWGTLYSFSVTTDMPPVQVSADLHVHEDGEPDTYSPATLAPQTDKIFDNEFD